MKNIILKYKKYQNIILISIFTLKLLTEKKQVLNLRK